MPPIRREKESGTTPAGRVADRRLESTAVGFIRPTHGIPDPKTSLLHTADYHEAIGRERCVGQRVCVASQLNKARACERVLESQSLEPFRCGKCQGLPIG